MLKSYTTHAILFTNNIIPSPQIQQADGVYTLSSAVQKSIGSLQEKTDQGGIFMLVRDLIPLLDAELIYGSDDIDNAKSIPDAVQI